VEGRGKAGGGGSGGRGTGSLGQFSELRENMRDQADAFLEHLRLNENASINTLRAYDSDISQFLQFLAERTGRRRTDLAPGDFDHQHIRAFLSELHRRGNSRSSAARKLAAIRAFGRYLRRAGLVDGDPASLV